VLRAEKLDAKTVIHNYGHGGGVWLLDANEAEKRRIVEGQIELFGAMRTPPK
jgi:hypothetical protein